MGTTDRFGRPLGTLRVSVTDRCNLRCAYCMPEAEYVWLPRADLLTFEEIDRLVAVFVSLGVGTRAPHRRRAAAPPRPGRPGRPARRAGPASRNARSRPTASTWRRRRTRCGRLASIASPSASTRCRPNGSCACRARATSTPSLPALRPPRPRSARSSSIPSSSAARTTTSCRRSSSTPDASARKSASSNTWTSAARRTGPPPAWCPATEIMARLERAFGTIDADRTAAPRAGHALRAAERPDARHHRVDHPAVLRRLRSGPADRGRPAPHLPVCDARRRPARTAAKRHERRRSRDADSRRLAGAARSRRRGAPGASRIAPRSSLATRCGPSPTSKCTRAAADAAAAHRNSSVPVFEAPQGPDEATRSFGTRSAISARHGYCTFCTCSDHVHGRQTGCLCSSYRQVCIPCRTASTLCASLQARARRP